jgi:hypothetical protein
MADLETGPGESPAKKTLNTGKVPQRDGLTGWESPAKKTLNTGKVPQRDGLTG